MKRKYLNLVMLAVVVALAAGTYVASRKKAVPPKPPLTALNSASIDSITIEKAGTRTLVLKRTKGEWNFAEPFQVQASEANVASILAVATSPCESAIKPAEVKLSDLGLAPPKYTVTFNTTPVKIGAVEPLKYRRYALTGGRICLISDPSAPGLGSENYANLVSTQLVPKHRTLVKLEIPGYTATREAHGKSWSLSPADPKAAPDAADQLASAWQAVHSMWNAQAGSQTPTGAEYATLQFADGSAIRYRIVARKPQLKLMRADIGIDYDISAAEANKLLEPAAPKPAAKPAEKAPAAKPASAKPG